MSRYVALLRGINVGKAKRVAMADLRALVAELGHAEVRTLLNSGNVVFSGGKMKPERVAAQLGRAIEEGLGVKSRVMVLTGETLAAVVAENALADVAENPSRLQVVFCEDPALLKKLKPLAGRSWRPEALAIGRRAAYVWCPDGVLASAALEAVGGILGESMTVRNWATVTKIHAAL